MASPRPPGTRPAAAGAAARLLAVAALAGAATCLPAAARAAGPIPDEMATILDGSVRSAVVGDVTGDGVRELVRILPTGQANFELGVQVVSIDESGAVRPHPEAQLLRAATPEDPQKDGLDEYVASRNDPARLLVVHDGGRERVLVAVESAGSVGQAERSLTLWQVGLDAAGGTTLRPLGTESSATSLTVADMNGDGTDELVATGMVPGFEPNRQATMLTWDGTMFRDTNIWPMPRSGSDLVDVGNTDGLPGDELAMVSGINAAGAASPGIWLTRLARDPVHGPRLDQTRLPFPAAVAGIDTPAGRDIAVVSPTEGSDLLEWPAGDASPTVVASSARSGVPLGVLGQGPSSLLVLRQDEQTVDMLDGNLVSRSGLAPSGAAVPFAGSATLPPYTGFVPGGIGGDAAFISQGRLARVTPGTPAEEPRTEDVAILPGMTPVGVFGPAGAWMGLVDRALETGRAGGAMGGIRFSNARLSVVPTAEVLRPETPDALQPTVVGAIPLHGPPGGNRLAARGSFEVEVPAPTGSRVVLEASPPGLPAGGQVDATGSITLNAHAAEPVDGSNLSYSFRLFVATPGGHGYSDAFDVQVMRHPPPLSASASTTSLAFDVAVRGHTVPGVAVSVDGKPVSVDDTGAFATSVPAGILPRTVAILATDPAGNQARTVVSVVAVSDYRTWPWIPIVTGLTIVAGAILMLRAPRARRAGAGSLEEIE